MFPPSNYPPFLSFSPQISLLVSPPQLSAMKGELGEAERFLHQALHLAHQADDRRAIVYTYSMVTPARCCPARGRAVVLGARPGAGKPCAEGREVVVRLGPVVELSAQRLSLPDGKCGLHAGAAGQRE